MHTNANSNDEQCSTSEKLRVGGGTFYFVSIAIITEAVKEYEEEGEEEKGNGETSEDLVRMSISEFCNVSLLKLSVGV